MKKITKNNDLIFNVILKDTECKDIPLDAIDSVKYKFYTGSTYSIEVTPNDGKIYLSSTVLANFSGLLKYDVHIRIANTNFPDGYQDIYYTNKSTNILVK